MTRDEFEAAVWQTFNPMKDIQTDVVIRALVENDGQLLAKWRVQLIRAKAALAKRMAEFDSDPSNVLVPVDPTITETE